MSFSLAHSHDYSAPSSLVHPNTTATFSVGVSFMTFSLSAVSLIRREARHTKIIFREDSHRQNFEVNGSSQTTRTSWTRKRRRETSGRIFLENKEKLAWNSKKEVRKYCNFFFRKYHDLFMLFWKNRQLWNDADPLGTDLPYSLSQNKREVLKISL